VSRPINITSSTVARLLKSQAVLDLPGMSGVRNIVKSKPVGRCSSCAKRRRSLSMAPVVFDVFETLIRKGDASLLIKAIAPAINITKNATLSFSVRGKKIIFNKEGLVND